MNSVQKDGIRRGTNDNDNNNTIGQISQNLSHFLQMSNDMTK